jgi:hypothetical protein
MHYPSINHIMETITQGIGSFSLTANDLNSNNVNLFEPLDVDKSYVSGQEVTVRATTSISNNGPYTFTFEPLGTQFIQLWTARMFIKAKVTKEDGSAIANTDKVAIVNNFGASYLQNSRVAINGQTFSELSNSHLGQKDMIHTLMSFGYESLNTHLKAAQFHIDTAGRFDTYATSGDNKNAGLATRATLIANSASFESEFIPPVDILFGDRLFPPGHSLSITFETQNDAYMLQAEGNEKYKFVLEDLYMKVRYVELDPDLLKTHYKKFDAGKPMIFPFRKTEIKTHQLGTGMRNVIIPNLYKGIVPKHITIGMLDTTSLNGSYGKNPYNYKHNDIRRLKVRVNGVSYPSNDGYQMNFSTGEYMQAYRYLADNTGIMHSNAANMITPALFKGGCTLFPIDMSSDKCNNFYLRLGETGSTDLELDFENNTTTPITVLSQSVTNAAIVFYKNKGTFVKTAI